jgi:hypothetical protein
MTPALLLALLAAQAASVTPAPAPTASVSTFRTQAEPRVDPVFGDVLSVRVAVDRFLALESEMESVRNDFSTAVHDTIALLPTAQPVSATTGKVTRAATRSCPATVDASYARALAAGARFLQLGRQIEAHHRAIRRADDLGDVQGLTPDYRAKAKRARELYLALVRDYREMRVAFYDQLGTELRFAGCRTGAALAGGGAAAKAESVDPANPAAWELDGADEESSGAIDKRPTGSAPKLDRPEKIDEASPTSESPVARAIWIDVDNARCTQPSRLEIDGQPIGEIASGHRTPVRTRAGPREVCLLPKGDPRTCGAPGTLRRAYFYEGLTLTVVCAK